MARSNRSVSRQSRNSAARRVTPPLRSSKGGVTLDLLFLQQQLLHAPVRGFGGVDFILGGASKGMRARELLQIPARLTDDAQHLSFERHLEDTSGIGRLTDEHHLVLARRNA